MLEKSNNEEYGVQDLEDMKIYTLLTSCDIQCKSLHLSVHCSLRMKSKNIKPYLMKLLKGVNERTTLQYHTHCHVHEKQ